MNRREQVAVRDIQRSQAALMARSKKENKKLNVEERQSYETARRDEKEHYQAYMSVGPYSTF